MKVKVEFLYSQPNDDLFAYFPEDRYDNYSDLRTAYSRKGQHSPCSPEYAKSCRKATPEESKDLKGELREIGYDF